MWCILLELIMVWKQYTKDAVTFWFMWRFYASKLKIQCIDTCVRVNQHVENHIASLQLARENLYTAFDASNTMLDTRQDGGNPADPYALCVPNDQHQVCGGRDAPLSEPSKQILVVFSTQSLLAVSRGFAEKTKLDSFSLLFGVVPVLAGTGTVDVLLVAWMQISQNNCLLMNQVVLKYDRSWQIVNVWWSSQAHYE